MLLSAIGFCRAFGSVCPIPAHPCMLYVLQIGQGCKHWTSGLMENSWSTPKGLLPRAIFPPSSPLTLSLHSISFIPFSLLLPCPYSPLPLSRQSCLQGMVEVNTSDILYVDAPWTILKPLGLTTPKEQDERKANPQKGFWVRPNTNCSLETMGHLWQSQRYDFCLQNADAQLKDVCLFRRAEAATWGFTIVLTLTALCSMNKMRMMRWTHHGPFLSWVSGLSCPPASNLQAMLDMRPRMHGLGQADSNTTRYLNAS